jgi:hypothetical protein
MENFTIFLGLRADADLRLNGGVVLVDENHHPFSRRFFEGVNQILQNGAGRPAFDVPFVTGGPSAPFQFVGYGVPKHVRGVAFTGHAQFHHRALFKVVAGVTVDPQTFEEFALASEKRRHGSYEERLAEAARSRKKLAAFIADDSMDLLRLVHVQKVIASNIGEVLTFVWQLSYGSPPDVRSN